LAKNIAADQGDKIKANFDKSAFPHSSEINDLVWYEDFAPLGKNAKLTPKWQAPAKISKINDTNARIMLPNGKTKILNIMRIKKFFKQQDNSDTPNKTASGSDDLNFNSKSEFTGPVTRAMKKLVEQQNATNLAISVLCDLSKKHCSMCNWEQECSDNLLLFDPLFARQYIKERQSWLINKQSMCAKCKLKLGEHLIDSQTANDVLIQELETMSKEARTMAQEGILSHWIFTSPGAMIGGTILCLALLFCCWKACTWNQAPLPYPPAPSAPTVFNMTVDPIWR